MKFTQIIPANTNFDFIGKFKFSGPLSVLLVLGGITLMLTKGFNFGIDFTGGTVVQAKFAEPTTAEAIRNMVTELGEKESSVVAIGTTKQEFLITVRTVKETTDVQPLDARLVNKVGKDKIEILQVDIVGPKVGEELKNAAILSLFYSLILIMIYIWLRFDLKFAPGATIALAHDLVFVAGFYVVTGREFTIAAVAALLTTAGYSVNDTIIIYDRARELTSKGNIQLPIGDTLNRAINATLSRTILTSGLMALSILPIIFFCTGELNSFADAMMVGLFVGTYSTIFIAAPFTVLFQRFLDRKQPTRGKRRTASA